MTDDLVQRLRSNRPIPTIPHEAADRIEVQAAEIERLKNKLSVETEPSPYCPICGSCGDEGCCGSKRCMYPDTGIEALEEDIKRLRERVKRVENNNRELRGSKERVYAATDLRQPTQSNALRDAIIEECAMKVRECWLDGESYSEVEDLVRALKEQSK